MLFRGDIYYADLSPVVGSEQGGVRPVLVIQNNVGNHYSPTVIVAAITSRMDKHTLPTHVFLGNGYGLQRNSTAMLEQIRTIDKTRLKEYIGHLDYKDMERVDVSLVISMGMGKRPYGLHLAEGQVPGIAMV